MRKISELTVWFSSNKCSFIERLSGGKWLLLVLLVVLPACSGFNNQQSSLPPSGIDLLPTLPLRSGFAGWQLWLQPGSTIAGDNEVTMVEDVTYGSVVQFSRRSQETGDGGAAGIYQPLMINSQAYPHIYLWLVGRVIQEEGGNLANHNSRWFPEGALQVRIKYLTKEGETEEWYHGFYVSQVSGADKVHFSSVNTEEWFAYLSPDLCELPIPPYQILEIRLYGFGWRFQGQAAEVRLIGSNIEAK